jgi:hypothetical protein
MTVTTEYNKTDVHGNPLSSKEQEWCENNELRLEPFAKTNWKTGDSRDKWKDLLSRASAAMREAEWRSVMSGETDRKAAIIHVNNGNREKWIRRVGENNLHYRDIRYTEPYNGFSHKHFPTSKDDPTRITYAAISTNPDVADKFEEAELELSGEDKHEAVGELLGFPECCREKFGDIWVNEGQIDPIYEISCNSDNAEMIDGDAENVLIKDPEPWANVMNRYFGWAFITHLPCSWNCEKSHKIAKARGEIMKDAGYEDAANALYHWLSLPGVWTGHNGIAHFRNEHMIGAAGTSTYWNKKRIVWGEEHDAGGSIL